MKKSLNTVFLIAGSEPLGSAGMQADIKAITACGGYAACAVTSIVDEDTRRIKNIFHLPVDLIVSQAESFLGDIETGCIKTGVDGQRHRRIQERVVPASYTHHP